MTGQRDVVSTGNADVATAVRLVRFVRFRGFTFPPTTIGPGGPLVGVRVSREWIDTIPSTDSTVTAAHGATHKQAATTTATGRDSTASTAAPSPYSPKH